VSKKALKTISLLWISSLFGAGCAFLIQVILARYLSPVDFGDFAAAFATVTLFVPLAGFGIAQFWLKVFGEEGWSATRWFSSSFTFIIISSLSVLAFLLFWAIIGPHDKTMQVVLFILSFYIFGQVALELIGSKLQLEEKYVYLALWQLSPHLIRLITIGYIVFLSSIILTPLLVALTYTSVAVIFTIIGGVQFYLIKRGNFHLKGHTLNISSKTQVIPNIKILISQVWPFGLAGLFHLIYFQSDIILIKYISGSEAAANYNVAFTVMVAVYILPTVIYQKFLLPKMHRWAHHDREKFYKTYNDGNRIMLFLGLLAMILIWLLIPSFIPFIFGANKYTSSIDILNILAFSIPVLFVASSVGSTLVTKEHMKSKVKCMGTVAIINIILNIILIPTYGTFGAAIATVISNVILLLLYYITAIKLVFKLKI